MKKSIFILVALFSVTFVNAQIELKATLNGYYQFSATSAGINGYDFVPASHLYNSYLSDQDKEDGKWMVKLYDLETFHLYKTVFISAGEETHLDVYNVSQNIFTTDGKVCFCVRRGENDYHVYLYNEEGQLLYTFEGITNSGYWKIKDKYLMHTYFYDKYSGQYTTYIYSLPGNGESSSEKVHKVNINGENCSLNISNECPEGTKLTVEAVADECFEFQKWSDNETANPRTINVTEDTDLTAEFNKVRYTITGKAENEGGQVQVVNQ